MPNATTQAKDSRAKLEHSARHIIMMLTIQFLLGMAVSLIGPPKEASGGAKIATTVFLALHVLIAIGLVIGAVMAFSAAKKLGSGFKRLASFASASIGATFVAGVLTMITGNNWWSYLMAAGFITSLLLYGAIVVRAKTS